MTTRPFALALSILLSSALATSATAQLAPQCAFETAHLAASDASGGDVFGHSVGLDGDTLVCGAYGEGTNGLLAGAAYVLVRSAGVWTEQAKLLPSDGSMSDRFGWHVDADGDTAVVSAIFGDGLALVSGSAYVFVRSGTTWAQQAKLVASDGASSDWFGRFVAISGDVVAIGSPQDDDAGTNSGSAYVYTRSGTSWAETAKVAASDAAANDTFGESVAIDGTTLVVGSPGDDDLGSGCGSAYVFTFNGSVWTQQAKLVASDGDSSDSFGWRVAVAGDTAIVGAYRQGLGSTAGAGAAYVFTRSGTAWSQQSKLVASDGSAGDQFGWPVSIAGDAAVVGAPLDSPAGGGSGSAYLFGRAGSVWSERAKLVASDAAAGDGFGLSTAIEGTSLVVGSYQDDLPVGTGAGSAYVFDLVGAPSSYCTAGTTSSGCNASIAGTGVASVSASAGFTLVVSQVEGAKQGVLFYGVSGAAAGPWGTTSSFLCVKAPTQRTAPLNSGGTAGACDGVLALDWNAFRAANPTALGQPFGAGDTVWAQGWFRDPPSPKTTHLSDALSFSLCP